MKLLKKTFALMLSLILVVGVIPGSLMTAHAAGTGGGFTAAASSSDGWDLYIDKNGKLAWNSKGDTGKYTITVDETSVGRLVFDVPNVSKTSFDLKAEFEKHKIESGLYYVWVATTNSGSKINSGTISTNYVSGQTKLAEPQQLQWTADGNQKWEPVAGATGYIFNLYDARGNNRASTTTTETEATKWAEDGWWFTVQATADGYRNSNVAESPKYGEVVTPPVDTTINIVEATVKEPEAGETPANATVNTTGAKIFSTDWYDGDTKLDADDKFESGKTYKCVVIVHPEDGYKFADHVTLEINGEAAPIVASESDYINAFVKFEVETLPDDTKIKEISITGLQEPVAGTASGTLTATFTPNDKFDVVYSIWMDESSADFSGNFVEGEDYQAFFVLDTKDGEAFASSVTVTSDKGTVTKTMVDDQGSRCWIWVKLTAVGTETPPATEYDITVTGGTASANKAVAGTVITLTAEQIDGKVFSHWEVNGATVSDANAKETTFTMGNADVTAEAIYDDCDCKCHKGGIVGFFYKIVLFFQKLFGNNLVCNCGKKH